MIDQLKDRFFNGTLDKEGMTAFLRLLLAERDSLKRVVSAPQARNHEAAAKADLGPVSAPCSGSLDLEQNLIGACIDAKAAVELFKWTDKDEHAELIKQTSINVVTAALLWAEERFGRTSPTEHPWERREGEAAR